MFAFVANCTYILPPVQQTHSTMSDDNDDEIDRLTNEQLLQWN